MKQPSTLQTWTTDPTQQYVDLVLPFFGYSTLYNPLHLGFGEGRVDLHTLAGETLDVKVDVLHAHHFSFAYATTSKAGDGVLTMASTSSTVAGVLVGACGKNRRKYLRKCEDY